MKPYLLPIRVTACAFDPATLEHTGTFKKGGALQTQPYQWAWRAPEYEKALKLEALWRGLCAPALPAPLDGNGAAAVCLSWALPPGWLQPLDDQRPDSLPRLPDRWLVVRIARQTHEVVQAGDSTERRWADRRPAVKAWIVDAGVPAEPATAGAPVAVVAGKKLAEQRGAAGQLAQLRVGRVRALKDASAAAADEDRLRLTARGAPASQDLTFAAFAPANLNNLSCIDVLDLPADQLACCALTYFVVGWYREPDKDDPLRLLRAAGRNEHQIRQALALIDPQQAAAIDSAQRSGAPSIDSAQRSGAPLIDICRAAGLPELAERAVFHGTVAYLDYWNSSSYVGPAFGAPHPLGPPRKHGSSGTVYPQATLIGAGATAAEALAALCDNHKTTGRAVRALLDGSIKDWRTEDERTQAERMATFQIVPAGTRWDVAPAQESSGPADVGEAPAQLTGELRALLDKLNQDQDLLSQAQWDLSAAAETAYTAWWLRLRRDAEALPTEEHDEFLKGYARRMDELVELQDILRQVVQTSRQELDTALAEAHRQALQAGKRAVKLAAKEGAAAPFYLPREPAIALRGIRPRLPDRPLGQAGRRTEDIARASAPPGARLTLAAVADELACYQDGDADLQGALRDLAGEAALVEEAVASLARTRTDGTAAAAGLSEAGWQDRCTKLYRELGGAAIRPEHQPPGWSETDAIRLTPGAAGIPLGALCSAWTQQPWLPLFLDWRADWKPVAKDAKARALGGRTLLANRPQNLIPDRIRALDASLYDLPVGPGPVNAESNPALGAVLRDPSFTQVTQWDAVGQSLSGIHQQLLGRDDGLPRPVPAAGDDLLGRHRAAIAHSSLGPPSPGQDDDLRLEREGSLKISALWVVDPFGQGLALDSTSATVRTMDTSAVGDLAIARRLLEPTRLTVEPAARPVRGWILPSRADRAVVVYDGGGAPLGLIARAGSAATWRPAHAGAPRDADGIGDVVLKEIVRALLRPGAPGDRPQSPFDGFLDLADEAVARTQPAGAQGGGPPAALLGRPLAVVQARVRFERRGGPVADVLWFGDKLGDFTRSFQTELEKARPPAGPAVEVALGCGLPDDGLIGFRVAGQQAAGVFLPTAKLGADARLPLPLPGSAQPDPTEITLLLDPHGKVYLDPQVLPVTTFTLPPEQFAEALGRLPAVLRLHPILLGSHAELRQVLDRGAAEDQRPHLELPLPAGGQRRADAGKAAPGSGARFSICGDPQPAEPLSAAVDPPSPASAVIPIGVAAVDGVLIA